MKSRIASLVLFTLLSPALVRGGVRAHDGARPAPGSPPVREGVETVPAEYRPSFQFRFGGLPSADLRGGDTGGASSEELSYLTRFSAFVPLPEPWFLRGGFTWQGFTFRHDAGVPLPDDLHGLSLDLGIGRRFGDDWSVQATVSPGLFSDFAEITGDDFNMAGTVGARWKPRDDFEAFFGVRYSPQSDLPVIPVAGFRWRIDRTWEIDLRFPRPRVICSLNPALDLYAGADMRFGTYRVGESLGTSNGVPRVDDAWLDYREIRAAAGVAWKITGSLELEAEAGAAVHRRFVYDQVDLSHRLRPAPYGEIALRYRF